MQRNRRIRLFLWTATITVLSLVSSKAARSQGAPAAPSGELAPDLKSLVMVVQQLQSQVQTLNSQVNDLRSAQRQAVREGQELRTELRRTREELAARGGDTYAPYAVTPAQPSVVAATPTAAAPGSVGTTVATPGQSGSLDERVAMLEDDEELLNDKITEQSQTKVESGSKYRVRFSGIVLLNTEVTRGTVDNLDFPQVATAQVVPGTSGAFSGSLRQSQLGVEAFGPDIAGAHTSANIKFDFGGGFPNTPNGAAFGIVRLRTGTIRLDWENTSIVAGQDGIFFAPLVPTTLTALDTPALSYTGNLWSWTPQVRIEHRVALSDNSRFVMQAGILDSLTGDIPSLNGYRTPTVGEQSGQPAYAAHVSWNRKMFDRELVIGFGGNYGRQNWGLGRNIDGWVATTDLTVPLGTYFDLTGEFYRGRAVGGFGGGIGQSILLSGLIADSTTAIHGLDSLGGWAQLKFKPKTNFEINLAYGQDDPFASELRRFPASAYYYGSSLSRNLSPFVNFIYRVRSDVLFSVEYRRLQTYSLDNNPYNANQTGISLGYLF
jgi:hypothetical protein